MIRRSLNGETRQSTPLSSIRQSITYGLSLIHIWLKHLKENPGELEGTEPADLHPHFLPYKTIGEEGVLLAVVLDDLCIHTPREVIHVANPVLALAVEPSALGKEYQVLLNSRILH